VSFDAAEVIDGVGEACTFHEMASGVPVPLHAIFFECEIDHSPQEESCGKRMFGGERISRWRQNFVMIAVELGGALNSKAAEETLSSCCSRAPIGAPVRASNMRTVLSVLVAIRSPLGSKSAEETLSSCCSGGTKNLSAATARSASVQAANCNGSDLACRFAA
jgi:hypothetical protein